MTVLVSLLHLAVVYGILLRCKRENLGWIVLIFTLLMTGIGHAYRYFTNYNGWDMSICQLLMMHNIYLSFIAWDYVDGAKEISKSKSKTALTQLPNLLEYFACAVCPNLSLGGPSGHIKDFLDYIYHKDVYQKTVPTFWSAMGRLGTGFCWIFVYGGIAVFFPATLVYSEKFAEFNFGKRVFFFIRVTDIKMSIVFIFSNCWIWS